MAGRWSAARPASGASGSGDEGDRQRVIEADLYDRAALGRLRRTSAAWRTVEEEGRRLVPGFEALLDDLFCALFKLNVLPRPGEAAGATSALTRRILAGVMAGAPYEALRLHTPLDEVRSGLGAVLLAEGVVRALREERVLTSGDLLDLWRLAEEEEEASEKEAEADVAREFARSEDGAEASDDTAGDGAEERGGGMCDEPAGFEEERDPKRPAASPRQGVLRDAARAAHYAARGAAGRRAQRARQVEESLARVGGRLDRALLAAAARAATRVQDLPDALATWGRGLGAGAPQNAGASVDLGRRLADNPKLKRLVRVFGRVRDEALAVRRRVVDRADEELHEIGPIASLEDLSRLVPRELLALSHPLLRRDFRRRLLEGELLSYRLRGDDARGRGEGIICLDVSSSMSGEKELWAKAVALTFVELARRKRRRCHVICFSSDAASLRQFDMNPRTPYEVSLARTLDLAEHSPGGGTDFVPPLEAACALLSRREHRRSDVVLITDGECEILPEWREAFRERKRKLNFALYAIQVDVASSRSGTLEELADRISRVSDLEADTGALFVETRRSRAR